MTAVEALGGLTLRTERLELRLPTEDELDSLAALAERGIHPPGRTPFATRWTDTIGTPGFRDGFRAYHLERRASWSPDAWSLPFGVWHDGELVGVMDLIAKRFAEERRVATGSWLGLAHQGRRLGTEMRAAVLELAFAGLGAERATTSAVEWNAASIGVSQKLGYTYVGRGDGCLDGAELRYELTRETWLSRPRIPVAVDGLDDCLPLFGVG